MITSWEEEEEEEGEGLGVESWSSSPEWATGIRSSRSLLAITIPGFASPIYSDEEKEIETPEASNREDGEGRKKRSTMEERVKDLTIKKSSQSWLFIRRSERQRERESQKTIGLGNFVISISINFIIYLSIFSINN